MFKTSIVSAIILASGLISAQANAAFVATDWKGNGDALATLDTNTGLEWLDLTVTDGSTFGQVSGALNSTLKGWRFPTHAEVSALMNSFFPYVGNNETPYSQTVYTGEGASQEPLNGPEFTTLFGFTYLDWWHGSDWQGSIYGLFKDDDGDILLSGYHRRNHWNGFYITYHNVETNETGDNYGYHQAGIFLVSDGGTTLSSINNPMLNINNPKSPVNQVPDAPADVSVHAGFGVLGLLLMAFGFRRRASA